MGQSMRNHGTRYEDNAKYLLTCKISFLILVLEEDDIHEEESARVSGQFIHFPHYFKLYESLRSAYANYKVSCTYLLYIFFSRILKQLIQIMLSHYIIPPSQIISNYIT